MCAVAAEVAAEAISLAHSQAQNVIARRSRARERQLAAGLATAAALRSGVAPGSGAVVVESLRDKRSGKPGGALVMRREGDDWTFFALDESGGLALDPARSPSVAADCAGCHREAPAGGLFPAR